MHARLSRRYGAEAKASLNRAAEAKASLNRANEYAVLDPKPSDLAMSRLKFW